jgi:hypothetical protein
VARSGPEIADPVGRSGGAGWAAGFRVSTAAGPNRVKQRVAGSPGGGAPTAAGRPIAVAMLFTVIGGWPLFFVTAYSVTLQAELGFDGSELGLAVSGYFAGSMVASQLGRMVDRLGVGFGLRACALLSALSGILIVSVASSWQWVAACLFAAGVANSVGQLASNRMLAGLTRQGLGLGMKQAAAPLQGLSAGLIVSAVGVHLPWRSVILATSLLTVAAAAALPTRLVAAGEGAPRRGGLGAYRHQLLALAAAGSIGGAAGNSLALLAVDSLTRAGFSEAAAVGVLTIGSAMAVIARVAAAWWLDHTGTNGYRDLIGLMVAGSAGFFLVSMAGAGGGNRALILLGTIMAFATAWAWPAIIYFVAVRNALVPPATATGVVLTGVFLGTLIGTPALAVVAEHSSYTVAWAVAGGAALVASGFAVLSRRLSERHPG